MRSTSSTQESGLKEVRHYKPTIFKGICANRNKLIVRRPPNIFTYTFYDLEKQEAHRLWVARYNCGLIVFERGVF